MSIAGKRFIKYYNPNITLKTVKKVYFIISSILLTTIFLNFITHKVLASDTSPTWINNSPPWTNLGSINSIVASNTSNASSIWAAGKEQQIGCCGYAYPVIYSNNGLDMTKYLPASYGNTAFHQLNSITQSNNGDTWSAGYYSVNRRLTLAYHWDGISWNLVTSDNPSSTQANQLNSIGVDGSGNVFSVGFYYNSSYNAFPIIEKWNGAKLAQQEPIMPSGTTDAILNGVSFSHNNKGWAVGYAFIPSPRSYPYLIYDYDGSNWTPTTGLPVNATGANLLSVSAVSDNEAWAAGSKTVNSESKPLILHYTSYNGWQEDTSFSKSFLSSTYLYAISADNPNNVWIVGAVGSDPFVMHYNSSGWSQVTMPSISGSIKLLSVATANNNVWVGGEKIPPGQSDSYPVVFFLNFAPTPTPSPTPSPTPTIAPTPEPFLDLPWDYNSQGKNFKNEVFNPGSWFDHEYPLQNIFGINKVLKYTGEKSDLPYRSHSGYDYNNQNGVGYQTPVLAAAAGTATFKLASHSAGAGNIIKIDHGNGYQTWYEHLDPTGIIVTDEKTSVYVKKGQEIGKTGYSGNVYPPNQDGAHIHFSVFRDMDDNQNFGDDYPYGMTDPLGWEGNYPDPWTQWTSDPQEKPNKRYGAQSYKLFLSLPNPKEAPMLQSGGELIEDKIKVSVPPGAAEVGFTLKFKYGPFESYNSLKSVLPSFFLYAIDNLGYKLPPFLLPAQIIYDYSGANLFNIKEETLKLYHLDENTGEWKALPSTIENKKVIAYTQSFSHFALMGETKDKIVPVTQAVIHGDKGQDNWYRSSINVELIGKDNEGGSGLRHTLYTLDGDKWMEYASPLVFDKEGAYTVTYESSDNAGNIEDLKSTTFRIDKTPPEAEIKYDLATYDTQVIGKDNLSAVAVSIDKTVPLHPKFTLSDQAGNTLVMQTDKIKTGKQVIFKIKNLQYNNNPSLILDPNIFFTLALTDKNNKVKQLNQYYSLKNDEKIFTTYSSSTNITTIYAKIPGNTTFVKETKPGIILLKLEAIKALLKYSY